MTSDEYNRLHKEVLQGEAIWRWEMLKAMWELVQVVRGGLSD